MEVIGLNFCFGKIMLFLLWKMDGGGWSGKFIEQVEGCGKWPGERGWLVELSKWQLRWRQLMTFKKYKELACVI